ncbi:MAG: glycoside hydrolase family 97 catalytic domain-containing protein [Bacteroidaceae bacterium]|nr:glycoside hydrolase family 97 catalytic domain-containing protein [Bacteroidaceae bacterium]
MKKVLLSLALQAQMIIASAVSTVVTSPDKNLEVTVGDTDGNVTYSVKYAGKQMLEDSPLGFTSNIGDFSRGMKIENSEQNTVEEYYTLNRSKVENVHYLANVLKCKLVNERKQSITVVFCVSNNDIAFRYEVPRQNRGETGAIRIMKECTGFDFPSHTTTFLTPQSHAMIGWKRSKPSYEETYKYDAPMTEKSGYGHGYTFPCLFKVGNDGWVLVSETGVDSKYCGCRLSDMTGDGLYTVEFPMPEENNGNGTVEPAFRLPGVTPWRTITVGNSLKPIVETTAAWNTVKPLYEPACDYQFGKSTWSWIVWQDASMNWKDQTEYIDLANKLGYKYILIDAGWDEQIGYEKMEELVKYAKSKNVDVFLWFSSSGYWNDIVQSPVDKMDSPIERKAVMKWMHKIGVKGIKVDFWGGDKQETMRMYEAVLSDANDNEIMVIFHGCTLPRGWERMYPNYVGSEAVLASENLIFGQGAADREAMDTATHPFIRNAVGCMEWGGSFLNRRLGRGNMRGTRRATTDCHELAQAVLFQNPIQNFALTPENMKPVAEGGAPEVSIEFMKMVPTTWNKTTFIDGYPGKFCVLARQHGDDIYIAGNNAEEATEKILDLSDVVTKGAEATLWSDDAQGEPQKTTVKIKNPAKFKINMAKNGGFVLVIRGE